MPLSQVLDRVGLHRGRKEWLNLRQNPFEVFRDRPQANEGIRQLNQGANPLDKSVWVGVSAPIEGLAQVVDLRIGQ
ncbi:hypothetical protein LRF89_11970 [Halorhodospira sp. 9621]|uniref:hypothetical protein n=1 Tax=Halorhodospira sp. 9621 TaxID=2899135 RepID=UPI001EE989B9|nr:hypothetical protein [Halorhodospira sp. 9621]MCG5534151.1 hypothetical protein [Halorhodospira sp. 9621]